MMKVRKLLSVAMAAAMLVTSFTALGTSASADETSTATIYDDDYSSYATYDGDDLGSVYSPESTTFKLWAPSSTEVSVYLYATGSDEEEGAEKLGEYAMTLDSSTGVWSITLEGDLKNIYYTYFVKNELNPDGVEVCDIYAQAAGINGDRAMVVDLDSTDPEGWDEDSYERVEDATDAIVWEVHVKDFSYDEESGVSEENRGKYLAFTELETTLNNAGDVKTCVNYLVDLGITYVQINPIYDFGSVDETGSDDQFNWGYDPKNYNVPEGSYSSDPYDGNVRINELKQMILALHEAGIGVIMDVVYNHTYASEDSWFNLTVPGYYYRITDSGWSNGSGCGNDTASERLMFKNYMVNSVVYWATEYHIDGFRFDLMGLIDTDTMNAVRDALDEIDTRILTYGEGWTLGSDYDATNWAGNSTSLCTQSKAMRVNERIGFFNDEIRDQIKGKAYDDLTSAGYVSGATSYASTLLQNVAGRLTTSSWKTQVPGQNIVYSCCHDNQTLYDRLVATAYGTDADYSVRYESLVSENKLASAIVMTSQGVSFLLAGEEFSRTKYGDDNSYKSAADLNMLDWSRVEEYADVVAYYKGMIAIRKSFDAFTDGTQTSGNAMTTLDTPSGVVGFSLPNLDTAENQWSEVLVYYNGSLTSEAEVTLPDASDGSDEYVVIADKQTAGLSEIDVVSGTVTIEENSALILVPKNSYDSVSLTDDEDSYVVVNHVDVDTGEVITKTTIKGNAGQSYSTQVSQELDGLEYDYVSCSDNTSGTMTAGTIEVYYYYKLYEGGIGTLTVQYVDSSTEMMGDVDGDGKVTSVDALEALRFSAALNNQIADDRQIYADMDGNDTINSVDALTILRTSAALVDVQYVSNGKSIASSVTTTARAGTEYSVEPASIAWYSLDESQYPDNATGTYSTGETVVTFVYSDLEDPVESTIYVKKADGVTTKLNLYLWDDVVGATYYGMTWPGKELTETNDDGWYVYTFENGGAYNWILNNGSDQTSDMEGYSGDMWIVVNSDTVNEDNLTIYTSDPGL